MKLGILGTGMIVKDVLTMYHELGVEKTYLFSTEKSNFSICWNISTDSLRLDLDQENSGGSPLAWIDSGRRSWGIESDSHSQQPAP